MTPVYSLVVPIFNEEAVLPVLLRRLDNLLPQLDGPAEVIFVDDGSTDASPIVLEARARADARFRFLRLSRNFGQQVAMTSGMARARGQAVVIMDADLQDPPEVMLEMIAKWREGFEIVYAQRLSRDGESRFKRVDREPVLPRARPARATSISRATSAISGSSTARRSTPSSPCRSATASCAACSPGSATGRRWCAFTGRRGRRARPNIRLPRCCGSRRADSSSFSDAPLRAALWLGLAVCGVAAAYALLRDRRCGSPAPISRAAGARSSS